MIWNRETYLYIDESEIIDSISSYSNITYISVFIIQSLNHSSAYGYDMKSLKTSKRSKEKDSLLTVTLYGWIDA